MSTALARLGNGLARLLGGPDRLEVVVGARGPEGDFEIPSGYDGTWETTSAGGRSGLRPTESAYYLYALLPEGFRHRAGSGVHVEVEYWGAQYGEFRLQYASTDRGATEQVLYKPAEQRWQPDAVGLERWRRAVFHLPDLDPARTQNLGASFRFEFRRELLLHRVSVSLTPPADLASFPAASTRSTTCSWRSRTPATSSAPGAPTRSWTAGAAS